MSVMKRKGEDEGEENVAAEEDWTLAVKVEDPLKLDMAENVEDGYILPEMTGMSGTNLIWFIPPQCLIMVREHE